MAQRGAAAAAPSGVAPWGRRRLLGVLSGVGLALTAALAGLALAAASFVSAVTGSPAPATTATAPTDAGSVRDRIAAAAMLPVSAADALGGRPATDPAPLLVVPAAASMGPAEVPSGVPADRCGSGRATGRDPGGRAGADVTGPRWE